MKVQTCPICGGKGVVEANFYPDMEGATTKWVKCRTCNGTGIVYVPEEDYYELPEEPELEKPEETASNISPDDIKTEG